MKIKIRTEIIKKKLMNKNNIRKDFQKEQLVMVMKMIRKKKLRIYKKKKKQERLKNRNQKLSQNIYLNKIITINVIGKQRINKMSNKQNFKMKNNTVLVICKMKK